MLNQERDAAAADAFEAWWDTYPNGTDPRRVAKDAWHAALASVQAEREAAGVLSIAADVLNEALYSIGALRPDAIPLVHALEEAIVAYEAARAEATGETPG